MDVKVLICVLCGVERDGWINPALARWLAGLGLCGDLRLNLTFICEEKPVERARNLCAQYTLQTGAEWLLMLDNDMEPPPDILKVVSLAGPEHDIIGLPYYMGSSQLSALPTIATWRVEDDAMVRPKPGGGFVELSMVGSGGLFIRRRVLEALPVPHFRNVLSDDGLVFKQSEDIYFCCRARERGFRIWTHGDFPLEHLHQYKLGRLAATLAKG
jgi:GT2 family glycosyltransferase